MRMLVMLGVGAAVISLTVTKSKLFKPIREWGMSRKNPLFGELLSCPYCFAHWSALFLSILYLPFHEFLVNWLVVTAIACPVMWGIYHSIAGIGGAYGEERREEEEEE
jgi:hypothetical protein